MLTVSFTETARSDLQEHWGSGKAVISSFQNTRVLIGFASSTICCISKTMMKRQQKTRLNVGPPLTWLIRVISVVHMCVLIP